MLTTWQRGRALVTRQREHDEGSLRAFVDELHAMKPPLQRVPGTAVFLNRGKATAPLAMRANVEHNRILHEHVVILSIETMPVPHVPAAERLVIDDLGYSRRRDHPRQRPLRLHGRPERPRACCGWSAEADIESPLDVTRPRTSSPRSSCAAATRRA